MEAGSEHVAGEVRSRTVADVRRVKVAVFPDGRVDRKNAAAFLGREPKTLAEWHSKGIGPRGFLVGGRVFYRWDELQDFACGKAA